jgi:peptidyl-prolyl cis-trans isomerase A (cyclophilin A)
MKKIVSMGLLLGLTWACIPQNWSIPQADVVPFLQKYGAENPENKIVIDVKDLGQIVVLLHNDTPLHRANFIRLIKEGYYKSRAFYRVVGGICIQGGGEWEDRVTHTVPAELRPKYTHQYGALAMAMYDENNPQKATSASEFFIVTNPKGYPKFNGNYTVFGQVISGMEVAEKVFKATIYNERPAEMRYFKISTNI